jgi:hypothetical protein
MRTAVVSGFLFVSLIAFRSTRAQTFESEGDLKNGAAIPAGILKLLARSDEVKNCTENADLMPSWFRAVKIELNGDRSPDYLIKSELQCLNGPRAATWWIFTRGPSGFKQVFNDSVLSLTILRKKTRGYRNIRTETTMVNIIRNQWVFDGRKYHLKKTEIIEPGR